MLVDGMTGTMSMVAIKVCIRLGYQLKSSWKEIFYEQVEKLRRIVSFMNRLHYLLDSFLAPDSQGLPAKMRRSVGVCVCACVFLLSMHGEYCFKYNTMKTMSSLLPNIYSSKWMDFFP